MRASLAAAGLVAGGALLIYLYKRRKASGISVYETPFDEEIKSALMQRLLDGEKDFLGAYWDIFANDPDWTLYRADADGKAVGIFMALDQGHGEAFLNGLRTDKSLRRRGVATAIIHSIDKDLARKGFRNIGMATTSENTPMLTLCKRRLGLQPIPFRMCQCNAIANGPLRATRAGDSPAEVDALYAWVRGSDYYRLSGGLLQAGPGQFRELLRDELARCCTAGDVYYHGPSAAQPTAVVIMGKSVFGPNPCVRFLAGVDDAATAALMDDLRALIPTDHPKGRAAAEVFGYIPVGSAACNTAGEKRALPSGEVWYCPRSTLQLVLTWRAGSL